MNTFEDDITKVIYSALTGREGVLSANFDIEAAMNFAVQHNIICILYYGLLHCGFSEDAAEMVKLFELTYRSAAVSEKQIYEVKRIFERFDAEKLDYMPMKGIILKNIYPKSEMRAMGDADILIRTEQYQAVAGVMNELGYEFQYESDHELVWKKGTMLVELHKKVMTSVNKDFYAYYCDVWKMVRKSSGRCTQYDFSDEDFYVYCFVHLAKHYRISGIGIKHFIDIWVLRNMGRTLDYGYVESEIEKLGLADFHRNVINTLNVWFAGGGEDDRTKMITNMVFHSGQYGKAETAEVNRILRDVKEVRVFKVKCTRIFRAVFPGYRIMVKEYPSLEKFALLLPVMWAIRLMRILIFERERLRDYEKRLSLITDKSVQSGKNALEFVGLDFNFKE